METQTPDLVAQWREKSLRATAHLPEITEREKARNLRAGKRLRARERREEKHAKMRYTDPFGYYAAEWLPGVAIAGSIVGVVALIGVFAGW